ncbi:MAG: hypothetical protein ACREIC_25615, partial [Limisphaerales bacterium]
MNLMQSAKLTVREWMVVGMRLRFSAGCAARCAFVAVFLAGGFLAAAQETNAPAQTNNITEPEVLSQLGDLVQATDSVAPETDAPPNDLAQANGPTPGVDGAPRVNRFDNSSRSQGPNTSQNSGGFQRDDRRSGGRRSYRSNS